MAAVGAKAALQALSDKQVRRSAPFSHTGVHRGVASQAKRGKKRSGSHFDAALAKKMVPALFPKRGTYSVAADDDGVPCVVMMNKTDSSANNNKFYSLALLAPDSGAGQWHVWSHNGRVGYAGQWRTYDFGARTAALSKFASTFRSKAGRAWGTPTTAVAGKYRVVQVVYGDEETQETQETQEAEEEAPAPAPGAKKRRKGGAASAPAAAPDCKLPAGVAGLVKMLTDVSMLTSSLADMNIDLKRAPLGKLSKAQIAEGYAILGRIETAVKAKKHGAIRALSDDFWSTIPHSFGFSVPPAISTTDDIKKLEQTLYSLVQIGVAARAVKAAQATQATVHPLDSAYASMGAGLAEVPSDCALWHSVDTAMRGTQAPTHHWYRMELAQVFAVECAGSGPAFEPFAARAVGAEAPTRLLWHGSRLSNFVGILSQGLRIAPPEAPRSGLMFGKAVYLADCASKSANYCRTSPTASRGVLLLCEAFTGEPLTLARAQYVERLPAGQDSTLGMGRRVPDPRNTAPLGGLEEGLRAAVDGASGGGDYAAPSLEALLGPHGTLAEAQLEYGPVVPVNGAAAKKARGSPRALDSAGVDVDSNGHLLYNEYMVYRTDQLRIRFVCVVDFNYSPAAIKELSKAGKVLAAAAKKAAAAARKGAWSADAAMVAVGGAGAPPPGGAAAGASGGDARDYASMRVVDLKEALAELGLGIRGRKAELLARLQAADAGQ